MTHICASKLISISSDNGLAPGRRQAIIWTNAGILTLQDKLQWNFNRNSYIFIQENAFENAWKWWPFCIGLNELSLGCIIMRLDCRKYPKSKSVFPTKTSSNLQPHGRQHTLIRSTLLPHSSTVSLILGMGGSYIPFPTACNMYDFTFTVFISSVTSNR